MFQNHNEVGKHNVKLINPILHEWGAGRGGGGDGVQKAFALISGVNNPVDIQPNTTKFVTFAKIYWRIKLGCQLFPFVSICVLEGRFFSTDLLLIKFMGYSF